MSSSNLLTRLQTGGQSELDLLFARTRQQIRAMIEKRLDRRILSRIDASDIVQETFVRASRGLQGYLQAPAMPPAIWLRIIGKQLVAETHRKHFRAKRTPNREQCRNSENSELLADVLSDSVRSAGSIVQQAELARIVRQRLAELPEIDREVLEMRHVDGLSMQEAAEALELGLEAAKKRYQRALKRFRDSVEDLLPMTL